MVMLRRYGQTNLFLVDGVDPNAARFAAVFDPRYVAQATWNFVDTWLDFARHIFFPPSAAGAFLQGGPTIWQTLLAAPDCRIAWMQDIYNVVPNSVFLVGNATPPEIDAFELAHRNYSLSIPERTRVTLEPNGFRFSSAHLSDQQVLGRGHGRFECAVVGNESLLEIVDAAGQAVSRFQCAARIERPVRRIVVASSPHNGFRQARHRIEVLLHP